jgi:hypothetical protein
MARRLGEKVEEEWDQLSATLRNEKDCVLSVVKNSEFEWAMAATASACR